MIYECGIARVNPFSVFKLFTRKTNGKGNYPFYVNIVVIKSSRSVYAVFNNGRLIDLYNNI